MDFQGRAILRAVIDEVTAADNEIIAAVAGQKIYVFAMWIQSGGTVGIIPKGTGTALCGEINLVAQSFFNLDFNRAGEPWFVTAQGASLVFTMDAATQISGVVYYIQAP